MSNNMKGFNTHRHLDNPTEKELHDNFIEQFIDNKLAHDMIDKIIYGTNENGYPTNFLSDHEKRIVITAIQWLGSHVGQSFLEDNGFKLDNKGN